MSNSRIVPVAALSVLILGLATVPSNANPVDPQSFDLADFAPIEPTITIPEDGIIDFYDNSQNFTDIDISGLGTFDSSPVDTSSPDDPTLHSFFDVFVTITLPPGTYQYSTPLYPDETGTLVVNPLPAALPLFATGIGLIGLFGWRRKRKNAAALSAA